jgi:serine/threonine protein kinase
MRSRCIPTSITEASLDSQWPAVDCDISVLGTLLGNYRVDHQLGAGGMGVVYVGHHEALGRPVVMKVLQPELCNDTDMVQRFFDEARAVTAVRSLGIVQVFDFGVTPDHRAYFVMERLDGESLATRLKQRRFDHAACCRLGRQVANVLQAAHAAGILHCDLKPANLFLVPDPEIAGGERVKVLDFGIAKLAGEAQSAGVRTYTSLMLGTLHYMSPEQCRSASTADARSDIYSLGCILFEMVCGRPPFVFTCVGDLVAAHLDEPPPDPHQLAPDVPPGLSALIAQMLAKAPDSRPPTMAAVSQALDDILRTLDPAAVPSGTPPSGLRAIRPLPGLPPEPPVAPSDVPAAVALPAPPAVAAPAPAAIEPPPPVAVATVAVPAPAVEPPASVVVAAVVEPPAPVAVAAVAVPAPAVEPPAPVAVAHPAAPGIAEPVRQPRDAVDDPSSSETTLPRARPHGRGRRLTYALGALVLLGSVVAIVLANDRPGRGEQTMPSAEIAAVRASNTATNTDPTADRVVADCRRSEADRNWSALAQCAVQLRPLAPRLAAEFSTRAAEEARSAPHVAAAQAALNDGALKQAKTEIDQVWPDAVDNAELQRAYAAAEDQEIDALATQLDSMKDASCAAYNQLLAEYTASDPPRVIEESTRRVPCKVLPKCDANTRGVACARDVRQERLHGGTRSLR